MVQAKGHNKVPACSRQPEGREMVQDLTWKICGGCYRQSYRKSIVVFPEKCIIKDIPCSCVKDVWFFLVRGHLIYIFLDLFKVTFYFLPWDSSAPSHHLRIFLGTFSKHQTCKFKNPYSTKYGKLRSETLKKITQLKTNIIWTKPPWLWLLSTVG